MYEDINKFLLMELLLSVCKDCSKIAIWVVCQKNSRGHGTLSERLRMESLPSVIFRSLYYHVSFELGEHQSI